MGLIICRFILNIPNKNIDNEIQQEKDINHIENIENPDRRDILSYPWDYYKRLNNGLTLRGHSRASERTCFYIKELSLYLDAGIQGVGEPLAILLTHGHCDHSHALPMMNIGLNVQTNVFAPQEITSLSKTFIISMQKLNNASNKIYNIDSMYPFTSVSPYTKYPITIKKKKCIIETFKCYHSVPTVGYGITEIRTKLKQEYESLEGKDIGKLRKDGIEVTYQKEIQLLAYIGDTTISVFNDMNNISVFNYPYIMIECTFFQPDHIDNAISNAHIHWQHLIPFVTKYQDITFILIHFSLRYRDLEILEFFETEKQKLNINNIIVWIN